MKTNLWIPPLGVLSHLGMVKTPRLQAKRSRAKWTNLHELSFLEAYNHRIILHNHVEMLRGPVGLIPTYLNRPV